MCLEYTFYVRPRQAAGGGRNTLLRPAAGSGDAAVAALESGDLAELGRLLDASHASLRDDYDVSVPAVERAVEACRAAGALGARIMGGGFGGSVLALFGPDASAPPGAIGVRPGPPARLLLHAI